MTDSELISEIKEELKKQSPDGITVDFVSDDQCVPNSGFRYVTTYCNEKQTFGHYDATRTVERILDLLLSNEHIASPGVLELCNFAIFLVAEDLYWHVRFAFRFRKTD
jgi:hypothetical protein